MRTITMQELVEVMKDEADIIDVREAFEYEVGHVPTARNIPMSEIESRISEVNVGSYIYLSIRCSLSTGHPMACCQ